MAIETNTRFGRLVVVVASERVGKGRGTGKTYSVCQCDCGTRKDVCDASLLYGRTTSCGCYRKEQARAATTTHGRTTSDGKRTKEYSAWLAMRARCEDERSETYRNYGGRGIFVCKRWMGKTGFASFYADMGPRPEGGTLDRIDTNGNYTPDNCRWVTRKVQQNNRRCNRRLTHNGETMTITQWASRVGISQQGLGNRLKRGWSLSQALSRPSGRPNTQGEES